MYLLHKIVLAQVERLTSGLDWGSVYLRCVHVPFQENQYLTSPNT